MYAQHELQHVITRKALMIVNKQASDESMNRMERDQTERDIKWREASDEATMMDQMQGGRFNAWRIATEATQASQER